MLQAITVGTSIALCLTLAGIALKGDLKSAARRTVLDDLGEFAAVHEMQGVAAVERLFDAGQHDDREAIRVTGVDGKVVEEYHPKNGGNFPWPDTLSMRRFAGGKGVVSIEHPDGNPHILIGRVMLGDGTVLWYGRTDDVDRTSMDHISEYLLLAGVAAAVIALIPLFWYAGQVLQPVRRMIASAEALAMGAGDERLVASSAVPELQEFATAFNVALDRNSALTAELQAANDHLAHELRTPLARIRGNLEILHDGLADAATRDAAARGMDEIDRASSLVQTILTVRAGEHNALKLHLEPTSITLLLADLVDLYAVAAEDKRLKLRLSAPEDRTISIDQQRFTQALANLLDNALAYTPEGGEVTVSLETTEASVTVRVRDSGPGVKPEEIETIWQRFVRGSASSARTPGMGLGLSLVRAVATAHGGTAGVINLDGGGAEFWITIPA